MSDNQKVRITCKLVRNITPDEYNQCIRMGYKDGCIVDDLRTQCQRYPYAGSQVVLAKVGDRIRSWALIDRSRKTSPMVQLWTQRRWRKKGLGRKVMTKVKQVAGEFSFFRDQAPVFFDKVGAREPINPLFAAY